MSHTQGNVHADLRKLGGYRVIRLLLINLFLVGILIASLVADAYGLTRRQRYEKAVKRYGPIYKVNVWSKQKRWMVDLNIEEYLPNLKTGTGAKITWLYVNNSITYHLIKTLSELKDKGLAKEIKTFDGCLNIRKVRGASRWSAHAYGLAIDLNASLNPVGTKGSWSPEFIEVWEKNGWKWGGRFKRLKDPMHFSLSWE
jgi:hypothetical protein